MNAKKWIFIGVGVTILVAGIVVTSKVVKKRKEDKEAEKQEKENEKELEQIQESTESQSESVDKGSLISPTRDINRAISNSFKDMKGIKLYPAKKSSNPIEGHIGAVGYANIRSSAEVNNESAWYDPFDNLLGKVSAGSPIGTIISEQYDDFDPPLRWFKVKLSKAIGSNKYGYVRADNVTFRPIKKGGKSSFDGNMVERYDTSYQLGASVFPHPNWMLGKNTMYSPLHQSWDISDVILDN